ncbi:MAG: hypothetical protein ACKV19_07725 [Verrucomicrobiales bacterium]
MNRPQFLRMSPLTAAALAAVTAVLTSPSPAQTTATPDAAKLLEQLKSLEESITKARTGNNISALATITEAAGADSKAIALWMDSVRETEFREKNKKESEYRAWRDGAGRRLSEPGAAGALRLHLQYLTLTIRVANAKNDADRSEILTSLLSYLDELAQADKATLKNRQALDTSVLATPIAKRYKLDISVHPPEAWSLVPGNLEAIYESSILPYLREKKDAARLQTAWARRIQQESAQVATQNSEPVTKNFREVVMPNLEWAQARDLYLAGSTAAAAKMLQVIQQNQGHKSVPQWIKEMRSILTGVVESPEPGVAKDAVAGAGGGTTQPEQPDPEPDATASPPTAPPPNAPGEGARPRPPAPVSPPNLNR